MIQFVLEKDADVAAQEVRDKVNRVLAELPKDADPPIIEKLDPDAAPVLSIALSGPALDPRHHRVRRQGAQAAARERLRRRPGQLVGGRQRQINVVTDTQKLNGLGLTVGRRGQRAGERRTCRSRAAR